jgi:hypothetical protein
MSIFTSIPHKPNVASPYSFLERGNKTDISCELQDTHIYPIRLINNPSHALFAAFLPEHVIATVFATGSMARTDPFRSILGDYNHANLTSPPEVGLSFSGGTPEDATTRLAKLGFRNEVMILWRVIGS